MIKKTVLYIVPIGVLGGASRSLIELIRAIPENTVVPYIISPNGKSIDYFRGISKRTFLTKGVPQFDNTRFGYYRKQRWLILVRELFYMPFFMTALIQAKCKIGKVDCIHVNEITALLPALLARMLFSAPIILHVRSVQADPALTRLRTRTLGYLIRRFINQVVAIDETVKQSLSYLCDVKVVHNSFNYDSVENTQQKPKQRKDNKIKIAMIGSLLELKGIFDFLQAAKICLDSGLNIEFVIVGENVRNEPGIKGFLLRKMGYSRDVYSECEGFIAEHELGENIKLMGFSFDVQRIYRDIDILCFPSHLEAVGRPVFEAAFFKVSSIVAILNPTSDTFKHNETGLAVPPKKPENLANAMKYLYWHPQERERMGQIAYELANKNFNCSTNTKKIISIYNEVINSCARSVGV